MPVPLIISLVMIDIVVMTVLLVASSLSAGFFAEAGQ